MSVFERITKEIRSGMILYTPVMKSRFTVDSIEANRIVFSVGSKPWSIPVPKVCWDGIPDFLKGKGWVKIGQKHDVADRGTLDEYLDTHHNPHQHRHPDWASYVVPVLEHLRIVEVDHHRPSKVRLKA